MPVSPPAPLATPAASPSWGRGRAFGKRFLKRLAPLPWLAPSLILIGGVVFYPAFEMFRTSFRRISLAGLDIGSAGWENFEHLFAEPAFGQVIRNTVLWVALVVVITVVLSLGLAQLLNEKFAGRRLVRLALIVPWAASLVMTASIWRWMLDPQYGIINPILQDIGIIRHPHDWLGDAATQFPALVFVGILVSIPFTTYVILAGLQGISGDLYEAARVDAVGAWGSYRSITLPLLRPTLLVAVILNVIYVFNSFPIIWIMTGGGPGNATDTTVTWTFKLGFRNGHIGEAAALAVLNVLALMAFILLYVVVVRRRQQTDA